MQAHTVQPVPGNIETDTLEVINSMTPDIWGGLLIPVAVSLAGGGIVGHLVKGWTDSKSIVRQEILDMRNRMEVLSERVQRLELTGSRKGRIAHLALDRVQDWEQYFLRRDETRDQEDPEHVITKWVPDPPPRLQDDSWTTRHRNELLELDE